MSTSNPDTQPPAAREPTASISAELSESEAHHREILERVARTLRRRHAAERRFRVLGLAAVAAGLGFVALLFASVLIKGLPAFWQATLFVDVHFDPALIQISEKPVQGENEAPGAFRERDLAWQGELGAVNWGQILENSVIALKPELEERRREVRSLFTSGERFRLRNMVVDDPSLIGQTVSMRLLADANVDVWLRGNVDRSLPDAQQQLKAGVRELADALHEQGIIKIAFNRFLFTNPDSRSSLASAGLGGAFMGSVFLMLIVIVLSVPIGVGAAVYLEEFAPRNRITDMIEVNINNLAAVPSIVFGLLGAAVFINWMKLPLSAPLVGGLVLTLGTLPTVIIAARASLRAVPPSIREAAFGIGASKVQMVFHHVLPLARPGILTGTIIGVAQALGETAPLLLIGMSSFVAHIPATPLEQSTALPVQVYLWQANELRNFFEARTSAAIIVLLGLMISLNGIAIWLRRKYEIRW